MCELISAMSCLIEGQGKATFRPSLCVYNEICSNRIRILTKLCEQRLQELFRAKSLLLANILFNALINSQVLKLSAPDDVCFKLKTVTLRVPNGITF